MITWDPINKGTGVVLSNNNLSFTGVGYNGVVVPTQHKNNNGKFYLEFHILNSYSPSSSDGHIGLHDYNGSKDVPVELRSGYISGISTSASIIGMCVNYTDGYVDIINPTGIRSRYIQIPDNGKIYVPSISLYSGIQNKVNFGRSEFEISKKYPLLWNSLINEGYAAYDAYPMSLFKSDDKIYTVNNNSFVETQLQEPLNKQNFIDNGIMYLSSISKDEIQSLLPFEIMTYIDDGEVNMNPPKLDLSVAPYTPIQLLEEPVSLVTYTEDPEVTPILNQTVYMRSKVRFLVSKNKINYMVYRNNTWIEIPKEDILTEGMNKNELESLSLLEWKQFGEEIWRDSFHLLIGLESDTPNIPLIKSVEINFDDNTAPQMRDFSLDLSSDHNEHALIRGKIYDIEGDDIEVKTMVTIGNNIIHNSVIDSDYNHNYQRALKFGEDFNVGLNTISVIASDKRGLPKEIGDNFSALKFNGINTSVVIPKNNKYCVPNNITVMVRVKCNDWGNNTNSRMISIANSGGFNIAKQGANIQTYVYIGGSYRSNIVPISTLGLKNDKYYTFIMTYDGYKLRLYLDNELINTVDIVGNISYHVSQPLIFGAEGLTPNINFWNGIIDYGSLWNKTLTQEEIEYYLENEPINDENLTGYWKLDEGGGNVAIDYSGNNFNGTINNGTWLGGVNSWSTTVNVVNLAPNVVLVYNDRYFTALIEDFDNDKIKFKIENVTTTTVLEESDFVKTPLHYKYTFKTGDTRFGVNNSIKFTIEDEYGAITTHTFIVKGVYRSLMFMDEKNGYYTDDNGNIIKPLDFQLIRSGHPKVASFMVSNQTAYDLADVMLSPFYGDLPDGTLIEFSRDTGEEEWYERLILTQVLKNGDAVGIKMKVTPPPNSVKLNAQFGVDASGKILVGREGIADNDKNYLNLMGYTIEY